MKNYSWLFGWCGAGNGNYTGIGDYFNRLHDANKPRIIYSIDLAGVVYEAQLNYKESDCLGFRMTSKNGENLDRLPVGSDGHYIGNPEELAEQRHERIKHYWPPELDRTKVWSTYINEPSKELEDIEYLARFALKSAELCLRDGFRYCAWGWSGGTPEREFWEHPLVLQYLRLCESHPDQLGVNIHLYSERDEDLFFEYEYRVKRWVMLYDVCRNNNIALPFIFVGEFGWGENAMSLSPQEALAQLSIVQNDMEVGKFNGACAIWTLGTWHGTIVQDMIDIVKDNTDKAVVYVGKEIGGSMPECNIPKRKRVSIWMPPFEQLTSAQLQQVIIWAEGGFPDNNDVMTDGEHMLCPSHEDAIAIHDSGSDNSILAVAYPDSIGTGVNDQWLLDNYPCVFNGNKQVVYLPKETESNPLTGLQLGHLFEYQYAYGYSGGRFDDPREYGNGKHEGVDADVIGGNADNKVNVLCTYDGVVDISIDSSGGYGKYVRVKHIRNGSEFYTRYTHLDARFVQAGTGVSKGTALGEVGSTGNVTGEHVHLNLEVPNYGLRGYVVDWVVDPAPYLPKDNMSLPPITGSGYVYSGAPVTYRPLIEAPADDWRWPIAKGTIDSLGIGVKFKSHGTNANYYNEYSQAHDFLPIRLFFSATNYISPDVLYKDTWKGQIQNFYNQGARDFELFNEPNIEGVGVFWSNGAEYANYMKQICQFIKRDFQDARIWFTAMSPGVPYTNQYIWVDAAWPILKEYCYGFCTHSYTGNNTDVNVAVSEIISQIDATRKRYNLQKPLFLSETSVNRGKDYNQKAMVYKKLESELSKRNGIKASSYFISDWYSPPASQAEHGESWYGTSLPQHYLSIP